MIKLFSAEARESCHALADMDQTDVLPTPYISHQLNQRCYHIILHVVCTGFIIHRSIFECSHRSFLPHEQIIVMSFVCFMLVGQLTFDL